MPFRSKAQWRAAFSGKIPGISADQAREWADKTDWEGLPEHADKSASLLTQAAYAAKILSRKREKTALFTKLAYALPRVGAVRVDSARNIGGFKGVATNNFLKAPGPVASKKVVNPNRSISSAMNTFKA